MKKILFVCLENTCRSAMAESIFKAITKGDKKIKCYSAGLEATEGQPMTENAVLALKQLGINPRKHKSKKLTREIMKGCIIYDLNKYVADPFGGDLSSYVHVAKLLYNWLTSLYNDLKEGRI